MAVAEIATTPSQLAELTAQSRVFRAQDDGSYLPSESEHALELAHQHSEIVQPLVTAHVDCMQGATSFSLRSVLEHGLVPTSTIEELGITALGYEHRSEPYSRKSVHVVPWTRAGETIRYAERRVDLYSPYDYVTPDNAAELAELEPSAYEHIADTGMGAHMLGIIGEARRFVASSRTGDAQPFYPVVYGLDSTRVPTTTPIKAVQSAVRGDTGIEGIVPPEAISIIFAPSDHIQELERQLSHGRPDIHFGSLETLRTLDAEMYGWMLPRR